MSPAEISFAITQFSNEISSLKGEDLLDRWIAFEGSPESKEPDLGMLKSNCLEAALVSQFGLGKWQKAVAKRREHQDNAPGA